LEVAAADRAERRTLGDEHAGGDAARHRAVCCRDLDDDRGASIGEPVGGEESKRARVHGEPGGERTAAIARRIASGVAGAASGGSTRCPPTAETASRIAKKTENGSSSGGSPVALLRWIVAATLSSPWPSFHSRTSKTGGQSFAVGIL